MGEVLVKIEGEEDEIYLYIFICIYMGIFLVFFGFFYHRPKYRIFY